MPMMIKRGETQEIDAGSVCFAVQPSTTAYKVLLAVDREVYPVSPEKARELAALLVAAAEAVETERVP